MECSPQSASRAIATAGNVMAHITNAKSQSLLAGIIAAAALSWPAVAGNEVVPNFMPDEPDF
jgi:hypothetical protein